MGGRVDGIGEQAGLQGVLDGTGGRLVGPRRGISVLGGAVRGLKIALSQG